MCFVLFFYREKIHIFSSQVMLSYITTFPSLPATSSNNFKIKKKVFNSHLILFFPSVSKLVQMI